MGFDEPDLRVRLLISGWSGSSNLGDELVLKGLLRLVEGHDVAVVSVDPERTRSEFDRPTIAPRQINRLARAVKEADLLIFGGGGLLQDSTSPFNLPYHLSRPALARVLGTPFVGLGLGAGPLERRGSRQLVRSLRHAVAISVRDEASRRLLADLEVPATVGADLAFALPPVDSAPEDVITVSFRPWSGGGGLVPVGTRRRHAIPQEHLAVLAHQLDELSGFTGWPVRMVALQADRDQAVHEDVAALMRSPVTLASPNVRQLVDEVGAGRLVVAMRYHAGVSATLAGRPTVLLGYSPKVEALAEELGAGARLLAWEPHALQRLADTGAALPGNEAAVRAARDRLIKRGQVDREVLQAGLAAA